MRSSGSTYEQLYASHEIQTQLKLLLLIRENIVAIFLLLKDTRSYPSFFLNGIHVRYTFLEVLLYVNITSQDDDVCFLPN